MSTRSLALAAHLLGVILWVGGIAVAASMAAFAAKRGESREAMFDAARRSITTWVTPGMLLAWAGGLTMLVPDFTTVYARAGWMHGKLTLLIVLSGITGVLAARIRKAAAGTREAPPKLLDGLAIAVVVGAAVILFLAVLKPGA